MPIEIQAPRITSVESPRALIALHFPSMSAELPISGGWGYTKEDAVVIDRDDPTVLGPEFFDGVAIEYIFVEKRIYEEMIIFRPDRIRFSGIEWKLNFRSMVVDDNRRFDILVFDVTAFQDADWQALKRDWEENPGILDQPEAMAAHFEKREEKKVHYKAEFWFDITSFFGV